MKITSLIASSLFLCFVATSQDTIPPVFIQPPNDVTVSCAGDVPTMVDVMWSDNVDGTGFVTGSDVSDGMSCPETITRTWTYTDACGNTASTSQTIIVHDMIPPTASNPDTIFVNSGDPIPNPDVLVVTDEDDNCGIATVSFVSDVNDSDTCETITRTYSVMDDCGNETLATQIITYCHSLSFEDLSATTIDHPWPNPTEGLLNFDVSLNDYHLIIHSMDGSIVSPEKYQLKGSDRLSLDAEKGVYIVQLTPVQGGQSQYFRIVKSK